MWDFIVISLIALDQTFGIVTLAGFLGRVGIVVGAFMITYVAVNGITHAIEP